MRHCGLGQEVAYWYQCGKNLLTCLLTLVLWCENGWVCSSGKISLKMLGLTFSSKLDWSCYIFSLLLKVPPRNLEPWFILWSPFPLRLLCFSIKLPYTHVWNTVVMFELVLLLLLGIVRYATKTDMQDCWSFPCCISWTLDSLSKFSQLKSFLWVLLW